MTLKKTASLLMAIFLIMACSLFSNTEPPGVGEKADRGYTTLSPVIEALENYQAELGKYPETLSELVPNYIEEVPVEVNEQSISYTRTADGYALSFHYLGPGMNTCTYTPEEKWQCSGAY